MLGPFLPNGSSGGINLKNIKCYTCSHFITREKLEDSSVYMLMKESGHFMTLPWYIRLVAKETTH